MGLDTLAGRKNIIIKLFKYFGLLTYWSDGNLQFPLDIMECP